MDTRTCPGLGTLPRYDPIMTRMISARPCKGASISEQRIFASMNRYSFKDATSGDVKFEWELTWCDA